MKGDFIPVAPNGALSDLKPKGFKVYAFENKYSGIPLFGRRDFYKICLSTGETIIHYADKSVKIDGTHLFFGNPHVPYSAELISPVQTGFGCFFSEEFLSSYGLSESLQESPVFKIGGTPILAVNEEQKEFLASFFKRMIIEQDMDYAFKRDVIRNYINLVIHEALKLQPIGSISTQINAHTRITNFFFELLERQFPIETPQHPLKLKTANDFARRLSIHVNYLNRSVKEVTGKPTTFHISERIVCEAKALLQHTGWTIGEIAFSLGFEYPTYFNNFFKRMTGVVPTSLRK